MAYHCFYYYYYHHYHHYHYYCYYSRYSFSLPSSQNPSSFSLPKLHSPTFPISPSTSRTDVRLPFSLAASRLLRARSFLSAPLPPLLFPLPFPFPLERPNFYAGIFSRTTPRPR